jgi:hypothetical protein
LTKREREYNWLVICKKYKIKNRRNNMEVWKSDEYEEAGVELAKKERRKEIVKHIGIFVAMVTAGAVGAAAVGNIPHPGLPLPEITDYVFAAVAGGSTAALFGGAAVLASLDSQGLLDKKRRNNSKK